MTCRARDRTRAPAASLLRGDDGERCGELTQSSEHLHAHVLPIIDAHDRPARALSWEDVLVATREEWLPLRARMAAAFDEEP